MANDRELLDTARKRFQRARDAEEDNRRQWRDSWEFGVLGDQWDESALAARRLAGRPALTVNKLAHHVRQVVNDIRQNRPAIKVLPVDDRADIETAEILTGLCRHIYHSSDGEIATDTAAEHAVVSGWGYFRVLTELIDPADTMQEIVIRRIANPLSVYLDPDATDPTGADAQWCFITERVAKDEAKRRYKLKDKDFKSWESEGEEWSGWHDDESITVAEYLWREDGAWQWRKLVADRVVESGQWIGRYLPIIRVIGNESIADGKVEYWGLVKPAKDSQQLYNLWVTAEAETVALMPKSPYIMPAGAEHGYEDEWASANTDNRPYVRYNSIDANGNPVAAPQRAQPAIPPAGIIQAKLGASDDIKAVTGQYDASLGKRSNETSGRAIIARQREGDNATYHYVDNVSRSMRQCGRVIVDLIPRIYDVARVARILGEDNEPQMVQFDPSIQQAMQAQPDATGAIRRIYNPGMGRYDVMVVTGPSFTTKRQEGAEWMTQALQGNPGLLQIMGDLYFRSLDVPYADEIAKRMKAMLPPQIAQMEQQNDQGIPPQVAAQMQQMGAALQDAQAQLQAAAAEVGKAQQAAQSKQGDLQIKQGDLQLKQQELQIKAQELELKAAEVQIKASEMVLKDRELTLKESELQADTTIETAKLQADSTIEMAKLRADTRIRLAELGQAQEGEEDEDEEGGEPEEKEIELTVGVQLAREIGALQQQVASLAQMVASTTTVSVEPIKDEMGRIIGGRVLKADGQAKEIKLR